MRSSRTTALAAPAAAPAAPAAAPIPPLTREDLDRLREVARSDTIIGMQALVGLLLANTLQTVSVSPGSAAPGPPPAVPAAPGGGTRHASRRRRRGP
jgi:hypothetical protein